MKLTKYLQNDVLPVIIRDFRGTFNSRKKKITSHEYCERLKKKGILIHDTTFRQCVKYIQFHGLLRYIIADSDGFYKTTSRVAIQKQIDTLKSRETEIRKVRMSIERQFRAGS